MVQVLLIMLQWMKALVVMKVVAVKGSACLLVFFSEVMKKVDSKSFRLLLVLH